MDGQIAVIGMACRVPGAAGVDRFWQNLVTGTSARTELSRDRLLAAGVPAAELDDPSYVPVGYLLDDIDLFDAGLFGMTPREAALTDPQHRLFLELCHAALEDAGWDPARFDGDIGVYGGRGMETYRWQHVYRNRAVADVSDHMTVGVGNHADAFTTLVSYRLNLHGPSVGVYTACSTSLVAVHLAAEALRAGECDMALAGGVTIELPQGTGYRYREGGAESADGDCRPFDASATGTVWGSGGGAVLLKRLDDAVADGDHVRGVVLGNAINNDGAGKVGFTAPSVEGQAAVLANALAAAGVSPRTVSYVETHGTGTPLGDPMEVAALTSVYGRASDDRGWCALGSVKSNIGHLSHGAGVVGLIKSVLALEHGIIPPSLGYTTPNPALGLDGSPFYVNATVAKWERDGGPRRAGVSSFGIGGTNAHVVLEEAALSPVTRSARSAYLLRLSARSAPALDAAADRLAGWLDDAADVELADVAYTLGVGRVAHPHRTAVVASDAAGAIAALRQPARRKRSGEAGPPPGVVFLFPGQGAQYDGMGDELYRAEPVFRSTVDECRSIVDAGLQPALFTVEYALATLWESWGVHPATMVGHSLGEYVAATLAGVFTLPDALRLVALRGRLMESLPGGAMLAVAGQPGELPDGLSVAAVNGPRAYVVSGPTEDVERFAAGVPSRRLRTTHAFHSAMMDPILNEFRAAVAAVPRRAPTSVVLSNRTGAPLTAEQAVDPDYWVRHLRDTVHFGDCVATALSGGPVVLLECGPGKQLGDLARMQVPRTSPLPVPSLTPPEELASLYGAAGRLWVHGVPVEPTAGAAPGRRVSLPGYPYERSRHWITPDATVVTAPVRPPIDGWFAVPSWHRLPPVAAPDRPGRAVVFAAGPSGVDLVARLRAAGMSIVDVAPGPTYERLAPDRYTVRPTEPADYAALVRDVGPDPGRWIHAWCLDGEPAGGDHAAVLRAADAGLFSVLFLVQALASTGDARIDVVTAGTQCVLGPDLVRPEHALLAGVIRCAPYDVPGVRLRQVDIDAADQTPLVAELGAAKPEPGARDGQVRVGAADLTPLVAEHGAAEPQPGAHVRQKDVDAADVTLIAEHRAAEPQPGAHVCQADRGAADLAPLVAELGAAGPEVVALRGRYRWAARTDRVPVPAPADPTAGLRPGGVYLITGGFGALGLAVAEDLARRVNARLILLGRTAGQDDSAASAIDRISAAGGEVTTVVADVTDPAALRHVRDEIIERYRRLDGIVHTAGVAGGGVLELRRRADMLPILAPKVAGTLALRAVFGDLDLDFVALFSSVSGAVGGPGEVDYCAANAWLDAYAQSDHGWRAPVVALAWGGWQGPGMRARTSTVDTPPAAIAPADGVAAFHRAIATDLGGYVLITPEPIGTAPDGGQRAEVANTGQSAPAAPGGDVEARLIEIWSALLGSGSIALDDDFFALGGNSLVAVQLIAQVRQAFGVRLPMRSIFDAPTVADMAAVVTRLRG